MRYDYEAERRRDIQYAIEVLIFSAQELKHDYRDHAVLILDTALSIIDREKERARPSGEATPLPKAAHFCVVK